MTHIVFTSLAAWRLLLGAALGLGAATAGLRGSATRAGAGIMAGGTAPSTAPARDGCPTFVSIVYPAASDTVDATPSPTTTDSIFIEYGFVQDESPGFCFTFDLPEDPLTLTRGRTDLTSALTITEVSGSPGPVWQARGVVALPDSLNTFTASLATLDGGGNPVTLTSTRTRHVSRRYVLGVSRLGTQPDTTDSDGQTLVSFLVQNLGRETLGFAFSCAASGALTCGPPHPGTGTLAPGASDTVQAFAYSASPGLGTLTLVAQQPAGDSLASPAWASDTAQLRVPAMPFSLALTGGLRQQRAGCPMVGAGTGSAVQCGDLVYAHALPGYRTRNVLRNVTLLYSSQTAHPVPVVSVDLTTYPGQQADGFRVVVTRNAGADTLAERWFDAAGADASLHRVRHLSVPIDAPAAGLGTGIHPVVVTVERRHGTQVATMVDSTNLLVVDRRLSPFGAGWSVAGVERLYPGQPGGRVLHVDANGSALVFTPTSGGAYQAPPGEYSTLVAQGGGWVRTLPGNRVRVWYGTTGLPDSVTDNNPARNRARYFWTAAGPEGVVLDSIEDARGKRLVFVRDGGTGRVVAVRTPGVADVALRQRAVSGGRAVLDTIVDPDGLPITFGYDTATARLTASRARLSGQFTYTYDATGRVASVAPPTMSAPAPVRYVQSWQRVGAPNDSFPGTSVTTPARAALSDTVVHRMSWSRLYRADSAGVWIDAPTVDRVQFRVDGSWAPTLVTVPTGDATAIQRDSAGQPILVRTVSGAEVRQAYDARGRLVERVQVERGRWRDRNLMRHDTTRFAYDSLWDAITRIVPPDTLEAITIGYDSVGRRAFVEDARGHVTRFTHGTDGQLTTISEPDPVLGGDNREAAPSLFVYDSTSGNLVQAGKTGRMTTYVYDTLHRSDLLQVIGPDGSTSSVTYDALKRPTSSTGGAADVSTVYLDTALQRKLVDGNGAVTTFTFDLLGRPVSECRPGNQCRTTTYGDGINATGTSYPGPTGTVYTTTEYGQQGLPIRTFVSGDTVAFFHDEYGRRTGAWNRASRIQWRYDGYGRMTCERQQLRYINDTTYAPRWHGVAAWHDYDRAGRRERTYVGADALGAELPCEGIYPEELESAENETSGWYNLLEPATWPAPRVWPKAASQYVPPSDTLRYTYDRSGNLTALFHGVWAAGQTGSPAWTWQYDAKNRMTQATLPTRAPGPSSGITLTRRYTALDDLQFHGGGAVADSLQHDAAGRVAMRVADQVRQFTYDLRGRIDSELVTSTLVRRNQYDALGNIVSDSVWTYAYETNTGSAAYGRLLSREKSDIATHYAYDLAGNTTRTGSVGWVDGTVNVPAKGDTEMAYDRWGRMVVQRTTVQDTDCAVSAPLHTQERRFSYDALGRRVTMFSRHRCAQDEKGYWRYWWLDDHVAVKQWSPLHEGSGADSSEADSYWPSLQGMGHWYAYAPGTDQVLGMRNPHSAPGAGMMSGTSFVFVRDHRGSVVRTYCAPNTASTSCPGFDINGSGIDYSAYGSAGASVKHGPGYNGLESSGGLVYMRNRWYDPNTGRFTQQDPIGYAGGINLYGYAGNDPVTYSDPYGLWPDWAALADKARDWLKNTDEGQLVTAVACSFGCQALTPEAGQTLAAAQAKYPVMIAAVRTPPTLPNRVIAQQGEVKVVHNYRSGDHGPAHAHVTGGGPTTRIGPKGHPLAGDPPLTPAQQSVVQANANTIRSAINKIGRWLESLEQ